MAASVLPRGTPPGGGQRWAGAMRWAQTSGALPRFSTCPEGPLVPHEDGFWGVKGVVQYLLRRYLDLLGCLEEVGSLRVKQGHMVPLGQDGVTSRVANLIRMGPSCSGLDVNQAVQFCHLVWWFPSLVA